MLLAAASFTSCSNQDNIIAPEILDYSFDEGSLIRNGQCETNDATNYWVNVGQDAAEFKGPATIGWDGVIARNHCVIVDVRSEAEARAAGNFGTQTWQGGDNTKFEAHDTQFFITFGEENALNENDEIRITMDVMADEPFSAGTGAHAAPGAYITGFGKTVDFTAEWKSWDSGIVKVTKAQAGTYSIAFDLAKGFANKVYFDNIRVEVMRYEAPTLLDDWTLVFWNYGKANDAQLSTKYFKNYNATTVEDGVIVVKSLEPGKKYDEYYNESGKDTPIDAVLANDHDTQLLFSLPQPVAKGTKMKITMKIKADVACNAGAQAHKAIPAPGAVEKAGSEYEGTYIHWTLFGGWGSNIPFTTEWETYEKEWTVPNEADGMQAVCLNLNVYKDDVNTYYFDDVAIYVEQNEVSLEDIPFYGVNKDADGDAAFGKDAKTTGEVDPIWKVNESTGQPYGDGSVNNFADLSAYSKLIVVATDGIPRIMLNRSKVEGQYNENEAESALIEYPKCESSWAGKYFSVEEIEGAKQYTVDLAQINKDFGWVHLHAIKGANWNNCTVTSMIVKKK